MRWRIFIGALLIACAFIPGPVDDFIIIGIVAKLSNNTE